MIVEVAENPSEECAFLFERFPQPRLTMPVQVVDEPVDPCVYGLRREVAHADLYRRSEAQVEVLIAIKARIRQSGSRSACDANEVSGPDCVSGRVLFKKLRISTAKLGVALVFFRRKAG